MLNFIEIICRVNWESNPISHGCLPCVISYLIENSVPRSYLKTIILTNAHPNLSLCDLSHNVRFMQLAAAC